MPVAVKKKKQKRVRRAPAAKKVVKKKAAVKKKKKVVEVVEGVIVPDDNPLINAQFLGQLAAACKYIKINSRPAKNTPAQRALLDEVAQACLKHGISLRGQPLTDEEKLVLGGYVQKQ